MNDPVIIALTPRGLDLGRRITQALGQGDVLPLRGSVRLTLQELYRTGRPLVCVMALGIVVRILGPLAVDKKTEPAVVVVDEAGRFAVSVLNGHLGGANELTRRVAEALGAVPVITTASEALGLPALDLIGREWGWKIEPTDDLTRVAAALVRGEPIGVFQDVGRTDWWEVFGEWPASFQRLDAWPPPTHLAGLLTITDRCLGRAGSAPTVAYRPPSLVLGIGCRRGTSCAEIESLFQQVCQERGYSPLSLGLAATADLKADEPGLLEFVSRHGVPLRTFTLEQLMRVTNVPTPSETVRAKLGIVGVSEPAALLAAGATNLLIPKQRGPRVTVALARRNDA